MFLGKPDSNFFLIFCYSPSCFRCLLDADRNKELVISLISWKCKNFHQKNSWKFSIYIYKSSSVHLIEQEYPFFIEVKHICIVFCKVGNIKCHVWCDFNGKSTINRITNLKKNRSFQMCGGIYVCTLCWDKLAITRNIKDIELEKH